MRNQSRTPLPVVLHVAHVLHGKRYDLAEDDDDDMLKDRPRGLYDQYCDCFKKAAEVHRELSSLIKQYPSCGTPFEDDPLVESFERIANRYLEQAKQFEQEIRILERLADFELMGEAYELLIEDFKDDGAWSSFIDAARFAKMDFTEYRRLGKNAEELSLRISATALQLSRMIHEIRETGVGLPDMLMPEWNGEFGESLSGSPEVVKLKINRMINSMHNNKTGSDAENRIDARRFLLDLSKVCSDFKPDFVDPAIRSALSTRQNSTKTSFIRAFGAHLQNAKVKVTPAIIRAMAITSNVVLEDDEFSITDDHVRKALVSLSNEGKRGARPQARRSRKTRAPKLG